MHPPIYAMVRPNKPAVSTSIPDAGIITAIKKGDVSIVDTIYDRYSAAIYGYLSNVSASNVDNALVDVFTYVAKYIRKRPLGPEDPEGPEKYGVLSWLIIVAMDLLQKRDNQAYLKSIAYFARALYSQAYHILKENAAAHELLQRSMLDVWENYAGQDTTNTQTVLIRALKDRTGRWIEQRERAKEAGTALEVAVTHISGIPIEQMRKSIQSTVYRLEVETLDVITAVFIENEAIDKIARDRGITPGDVFQHMIKACRRLSKKLDETVTPT